jgi:hypothetical protein
VAPVNAKLYRSSFNRKPEQSAGLGHLLAFTRAAGCGGVRVYGPNLSSFNAEPAGDGCRIVKLAEPSPAGSALNEV